MSTDPSITENKLKFARDKKAIGDTAFKSGNLTDALRAYHEVLLYVEGLDRAGGVASVLMSGPSDGAEDRKDRTEADELMEKRDNWKRAQETAEKALAKNPKNFKAMFRRAKALGEQGYSERAEKILEELIKQSPADAPTATAELRRLRAIDKERQKVHNQKLKGWLSRGGLDTPATEVVEEVSSPGTKEAKSSGVP
ncbi:TPR-like protein [Lactarius indigo]|nr:TPR-like protein [Lactarius indigo]